MAMSRTLLPMLPGAFVGLVVGARLLQALDVGAIKLIASSVVLLFTLALLARITLPGAHARGAAAMTGTVSGLLATSTGLSGPPVVLLLTARSFAPHPFRVTTSAYFLCINTVGFTILVIQGTIGQSQLAIVAALLPTALLGTIVGRHLTQYVSPAGFRRAIMFLLLITGALGIATTLPGMLS